MLLLDIVPLVKIPFSQPQILTYYTTHELKVGSLVTISLRKKKVLGAVISLVPLSTQKLEIKKADYQLKNISGIVNKEPILTKEQIELALWMSKYYWTSLGIIFKKMMPKKIMNPKSQIQSARWRTKIQNPKLNKQFLILVPQISQISAIAEKLENYTVIHNELTDKQYLEEWLKIRNGEAKFIIGTRSAVFAPFQNLSKIIIEQEENHHYKSSQQSPRFDGRRAAMKLSELFGAKLFFKSQTPSIETFYRAKKMKNSDFVPPKRDEVGVLRYCIIDMKKELEQKNFSIFSLFLQKKLKKYLSEKKQTILFISRRGTATLILCRDCGEILKCTNCDVPLVYHLAPNKPSDSEGKRNFSNLICHHCGHMEKPPNLCPACRGHQIKFSGSGTEKVEMEAKKLFPSAAISRLDSDIPRKEQVEIIKKFKEGKTSILIGTQILLSQNFNKPPLVAIISMDTLLHLPDFRSSERIFQIIRRLAELTKEELIIQTYSSENYAIKCAAENNYKDFFEKEIEIRKELNYPPFSQLIKLTYKHKNPLKAEKEAELLTEKLKNQARSELAESILDPIPSFIPKKQGKYFWDIIIKLPDEKLKIDLLKNVPPDWIVDVEPENLL